MPDIDETKLTNDAFSEYYDFNEGMSDRGCTCFQCAPCSYCTHPGNPENLIEDPTAWRNNTMKLSNIKDIQKIQRMAGEINEGISNYTRCKKSEREGTIKITATAKNGRPQPIATNKECDSTGSTHHLALDATELELLDWIINRAIDRHQTEINGQLESLGVDSKLNLSTGEIEEN